MLKTNSKKAIENLKKYVFDNTDVSNFDFVDPANFEEAACMIWYAFKEEYKGLFAYYKNNMQVAFSEWTAGLPSILNTSYYLNSAVDVLGEILEESESEKSRFSDEKAEKLLTSLIYREIRKAVDKNPNFNVEEYRIVYIDISDYVETITDAA